MAQIWPGLGSRSTSANVMAKAPPNLYILVLPRGLRSRVRPVVIFKRRCHPLFLSPTSLRLILDHEQQGLQPSYSRTLCTPLLTMCIAYLSHADSDGPPFVQVQPRNKVSRFLRKVVKTISVSRDIGFYWDYTEITYKRSNSPSRGVDREDAPSNPNIEVGHLLVYAFCMNFVGRTGSGYPFRRGTKH
jgi:hypothetical protein